MQPFGLEARLLMKTDSSFAVMDLVLEQTFIGRLRVWVKWLVALTLESAAAFDWTTMLPHLGVLELRFAGSSSCTNAALFRA